MNRPSTHSLLVSSLMLLNISLSFGQDPLRFKEEVENIGQVEYELDTSKDVIVFTGSSSIRMWDDIQQYFPDHQVVKAGFGGSQMSDLLYYSDQLILKYAPDKVFIYEGDNDIAADKTPSEIITTTVELVEKIHSMLPLTEIVLISAKPSISRWHLKEKYEELNRRFEIYSSKKERVNYADVWTIMLNQNGSPKKTLFLSDSLHMNKKGYDLWAIKLAGFLEQQR